MLEVIMIFECVIILMSLKHQKEQEILKADPESFNQNQKKKKSFYRLLNPIASLLTHLIYRRSFYLN